MNRFCSIAAAALCFVATAAHAQQAQQPSPKQLELADQVLTASGLRANFGNMLHSVVNQMTAGMRVNGAQDQKAAEAMQAAADGAMDKMVPKVLASISDIYARNFTEKELSDLLAFYQSPSGRSMIAKTPQLMHDSMAVIAPMVPDMQRDIITDFCNRLPCTPEQKKVIFDRLPAARPKS